MNYKTLWSYLRYSNKIGDNIKIPMVVLDACVGKGKGSKLLTEIEGEVLELLISAEQGAYLINTFYDLTNYFCLDINQDNAPYEDILTPGTILNVIISLQNKGFCKFERSFFSGE